MGYIPPQAPPSRHSPNRQCNGIDCHDPHAIEAPHDNGTIQRLSQLYRKFKPDIERAEERLTRHFGTNSTGPK